MSEAVALSLVPSTHIGDAGLGDCGVSLLGSSWCGLSFFKSFYDYSPLPMGVGTLKYFCHKTVVEYKDDTKLYWRFCHKTVVADLRSATTVLLQNLQYNLEWFPWKFVSHRSRSHGVS
jgi:hypothetical protein